MKLKSGNHLHLYTNRWYENYLKITHHHDQLKDKLKKMKEMIYLEKNRIRVKQYYDTQSRRIRRASMKISTLCRFEEDSKKLEEGLIEALGELKNADH